MKGFNSSALKVCRMFLMFQAVSDTGQNVRSVGYLTVYNLNA